MFNCLSCTCFCYQYWNHCNCVWRLPSVFLGTISWLCDAAVWWRNNNRLGPFASHLPLLVWLLFKGEPGQPGTSRPIEVGAHTARTERIFVGDIIRHCLIVFYACMLLLCTQLASTYRVALSSAWEKSSTAKNCCSESLFKKRAQIIGLQHHVPPWMTFKKTRCFTLHVTNRANKVYQVHLVNQLEKLPDLCLTLCKL